MEKQVLLITMGALFVFLMVLVAINTWTNYTYGDEIPTPNGPQFYRCPSYTGGQIMGDIYRKMGFDLTSDPQLAEVYLPCGYTWVEKELNNYTPTRGQVILAIEGCDRIVAKNGLWKVLSDHYGREEAAKLVPKSYITYSQDDMNNLRREFNPNKIYIMKKNIQRQQGLKLTRSLDEILRLKSDGYAVIQEYLMNPLLFDNRKFDIRIYLLVIQKGDTQYYYRHTGGRCHYTSRDFTTDDITSEIHIPSGYEEDKEFKSSHPETLKELQSYMNKIHSGSGDYFFAEIDNMLGKCCAAFSKVIGTSSKYNDKDTTRCQLFGIDVLSDDNLRPILIEINKGPELSWSSEPEKEYKQKLIRDMFNLLGYIDVDTPNEFVPVLTTRVAR